MCAKRPRTIAEVNAIIAEAEATRDTRSAPLQPKPSAGLYGYRWQRARERYLRAFPLCRQCDADGNGPTAATVVDHIEPHRGDTRLFWLTANWQSLCKPCHDAKTGRGA